MAKSPKPKPASGTLTAMVAEQAAAKKAPKPRPITDRLPPEQIAIRVGNRLRYEAMAADTRASLNKLAALDIGHITAVCALIDLFTYKQTEEDDTHNTNWLGGFIFGLLHTMTYEGPEEANRQPDSVRKLLNEVLENLEDDLQNSRHMIQLYKGVYEEPQEDSARSAA